MQITIVMLWVKQILAGKRIYSEVPRQLKIQVADLLREQGREDLIVEN